MPSVWGCRSTDVGYRPVLQLPAVGGRMPTERGMHKYSADAVSEPDWTLIPRDPQGCLMRRMERLRD